MRLQKYLSNRAWPCKMGFLLMSLLCVAVSWGSSATQLESVIGENNVYFFSYNTFGQVSKGAWLEYDQPGAGSRDALAVQHREPSGFSDVWHCEHW